MEKEGKKFSRANAGDRFVRVAQLFHLLGTDSRKNIDLILDQTRSIIEGFFSLYLHRDNTQGTPVIRAGSNLSRDLENTLSPGSLLFKNPLFTRHGRYPRSYCILPQEQVISNPLGKRLGLKACLGTPVFHGARDMGTLWLTDTQARSFTPDDILCIQALSAALGLEEERLAHEKQLLTTKTRLKGFYDASFEAIFLSKRGLCLDQNKTALRMFGYSMEEAVGKPGTDWILPEERGKGGFFF